MNIIRKFEIYFKISVIAIISSINYAVFIFPNKFAPSGIDGICTMIQDVSGINIGYLSLLFNVPLIVLAFFKLNREFAIKTTFYIVVFSFSSILLKEYVTGNLAYYTDNGSSTVLAPAVAGVIRGMLYALTLNLNGSSGGIDIVAAVVKRKRPYFDIMNVIFCINILIAFASFFVYDMKIEPVICSILYSFITTQTSMRIRSDKHKALKYEIITSDATELCGKISDTLHQTATVVNAKGAYSGTDRKMVVCVTKKKNAPFIEDIILQYPAAIVFKSDVDNEIIGIDYK